MGAEDEQFRGWGRLPAVLDEGGELGATTGIHRFVDRQLLTTIEIPRL